MDKELAQDPGSQLQSHINQIFCVALDLPWCLLSFCSPLLDDFENNVSFLLSAALYHVCLSCKLFKTGVLSGGLLLQ